MLPLEKTEFLRPLCRFHLMGSCAHGDECTYRHNCEPEGGLEAAKKAFPCPYFAKGKCRHRERCYFSHDNGILPRQPEDAGNVRSNIQIISSNTNTALTVDPPHRGEQDDTFPPQGDENSSDDGIDNDDGHKCGICLNNVAQIGKRFALYSNCSHCFCYDCARGWHRKQPAVKRSQGIDVDRTLLKHSCPECRVESDNIFPSKYFYSGNEKVEYVNEYKRKRTNQGCKHFKIGVRGSCPFGSTCFYAHADTDGSSMKPFDVAKPKGDLRNTSLECYLATGSLIPM